jgi:PBP1b-binding outer membrane lipoprotein LpoB
MMRKMTITGILILCLITAVFMAGCTSATQETPPSQTTVQQPAVTSTQAPGTVNAQITPAAEVSSAAPDLGLVQDDSADVVAQTAAFNTTLAANSSPDSEDVGDIMP